jgi:uncharacterized Zn-binding protein involved in type VI secretion
VWKQPNQRLAPNRLERDGRAPSHKTMKTRTISMIAALSLGITVGASGQEGPMNAGLVQSVSKEKGTLTIRTEQSGGGPIMYYGMNKAEILTVGGKPATLADIVQGQRVTVFYGKQGDHWVVSRVLIPEPAATTATAPAATTTTPSASTNAPAAARDGDRTTKPSNNQAAATDGDRTTRPSSNENAARDGDRTTVPGDTSRAGLHRR